MPTKYLEKLSLNSLYLFTFGAFSLFILDGLIPDPIPLVDEAALLYATLQGLRAIVSKRKGSTKTSFLSDSKSALAEVKNES